MTSRSVAAEVGSTTATATAKPAAWTLLREVFFVAFAYLVYAQVRGLAGSRVVDAYANGHRIVALERSLGLFRELSLQTFVLGRGSLIDAFNFVYFYGLFPLLLPTAIWLYARRPHVYSLARNAFLLSGGIAVCFFLLLPTAPPRLMSLGFIDTLGQSLTPDYQSLPGVNHYAALPSMHVGWSFLTAYAIYLGLEGARFRALVLILPVLMFASTVVTGNHYFLDGALGIIVAAVALLIALKVRQLGSRSIAAEVGSARG